MYSRPRPSADTSAIAKETIEHNVMVYERYRAKRDTRTHVPRLVDLIAEVIGSHSDESIEMVQNTVLQSHLWDWYRMPYTMLHRALHRLQLHDTALDPRIDEWILLNERWLRDGGSSSWQHGLITLKDTEIVFPHSALTAMATGRTITRPHSLRLDSLRGFEALCSCREPQITIQPSTEAFEKAFDYMSDGILKDLDWSNVFVAGGIALGTLLSVCSPGCNLADVGEPWESSDIDLYIYGLSAAESTAKVRSIYETFRSNLLLDPANGRVIPTLAVKNPQTITFYARYPVRRVQIILKLVETPKDVLLNFDLDVCAIGWDGSEVWMLPRAARALETGSNVFTMDLIHGHYLSDRRASQHHRIFKYANRGYGLRFLPSYLSSLNQAKEPIPENHSGEHSLPLDIQRLAEESRIWAREKYEEMKTTHGHEHIPRYSDLDHHRSSCLTGFTLLMRSVAYWEIAQEIAPCNNVLVENLNMFISHENTYDDDPNAGQSGSRWNERFRREALMDSINRSNRKDVQKWLQTDTTSRLRHHGVKHGDELDDAQRLTYASNIDVLLDPAHAIRIPVLVPPDFASYANEVVNQVHGRAHLSILKPVLPPIFLDESNHDQEGLFFWIIPTDLMWQQESRRIDELFEVLLAFRKANLPIQAAQDLQAGKFLEELSRRKTAQNSDDNFKAFGRWIRNNDNYMANGSPCGVMVAGKLALNFGCSGVTDDPIMSLPEGPEQI
ncbi:hypothetical protein B0H13DRAFT_2664492 [Mycena leptocephala]|nr:hypothetical protein B0H13DRAFT_2664492 [Mycena leptocephala]